MENEKKVSRLAILSKVIPFIALEVFAILAFNLGNSIIFFAIVLALLTVFTVIFSFKQYNSDGLMSFAFILFPLFIYGLLTALSYFNQDTSYDLHGGLSYLLPVIFILVSFCGYSLSFIKEFKIKTAMVVIYSAIAALTVINLFATLIEFTPFYTLIYNGKYLYYDGAPSALQVSEMAFSLVGFNMVEVSVRYFSLFPTMLLTAFVPLFFIKYNDNKKLYIAYLLFGILGALTLIFTVSIFTAITDVLAVILIAVIVGYAKGKIKGKTIKIAMVVIGVIALLAFILLTIVSQSNASGFVLSIQKALKGNSLLDRLLFTNKFIKPYRTVLDGLFNSYKTFGSPTYSTYDFLAGIKPTGSWLFDNFFTSGLFGGLFFIFAIVVGVRRLIIYYKHAEEGQVEKIMVITFILMFLTYTAVNYDMVIPSLVGTLSPVYESGLFMLVMILLTYAFAKSLVYNPKGKKEEKKEEVENEEITL